MQVIGLTGGVGAGKSLILQMLKEEYGACVISADEVGHRLMEPGGSTYQALVNEYGLEILDSQGRIDKTRLAAIGFADESSAKRLNGCTHPLILQEIAKEIQAAEGKYPFAVLECAIPKEGRLQEFCNKIWYVSVPEKLRCERIMETRGYSKERAEALIRRQPSEEEYRAMSQAVIENSGSVEDTRDRVAQLVSELSPVG